MTNQITIEGLTKKEINGSIEYINKCLEQESQMEAWEVKEYKNSLAHFNSLLSQINNQAEYLKAEGIAFNF